MKAVWNNRTIAKSDNVVEIDGAYYFPLNSVNWKYFYESDTKSTCPIKGKAFYFHIEVAGKFIDDAAWYYTADSQSPDILKYRIAFWKGVEFKESDTSSVLLPKLKSLFSSLF